MLSIRQNVSWSKVSRTVVILSSNGSNKDRSAPFLTCKRNVRRWHRAYDFPPNMSSHHFFLPSLQQYLHQEEAENNPVVINDIGFSNDEFMKRLSIDVKHEESVVKKSRSRRRDPLDVSSPQELVELVDVEITRQPFNFEIFKIIESMSEEGKERLKQLAHHYQIYRDLFSSPSQIETRIDVPIAKIPSFVPPSTRENTEVLEKWFSGARPREKIPPKQIYHFTPHVPIYAEFGVKKSFIDSEGENEGKGGEEELVVSPVHSGNVIDPLYASSKPSVVIDARGKIDPSNINKSYFEEVEAGKVKIICDANNKSYHTLMLLNLDTTLGDDKPICHWMVTNISSSGSTEVFPFLPIYGIRGFGYHRYVFLVYQHDSQVQFDPVTSNSFIDRMVDPLNILKSKDDSATPVGLSWFQSQWDSYSQKVLHHQLNMRAPVYEYIEPEETPIKQTKYPVLAPFNIYLDRFRHPKEMVEEAFVERLKSIDPFNYEKQFEVDPLPNAYGELRDQKHIPTWMHSKIWKKRNRLGQFRVLRPASAKSPLNYNFDLDRPIWPYPGKLELPMRYPDGTRRPVPLRTTKWVIPAAQHPTYRIEHEDIIEEQKKMDAKE